MARWRRTSAKKASNRRKRDGYYRVSGRCTEYDLADRGLCGRRRPCPLHDCANCGQLRLSGHTCPTPKGPR